MRPASHLASPGCGGMPLTERAVVYRLFEEHFERYVREYEERYEAREGSLRVEEVFRRRLLQRLHGAERLSEGFLRSLLGWVHSGFSVHGEQKYRPTTSRARSASRAI